MLYQRVEPHAVLFGLQNRQERTHTVQPSLQDAEWTSMQHIMENAGIINDTSSSRLWMHEDGVRQSEEGMQGANLDSRGHIGVDWATAVASDSAWLSTRGRFGWGGMSRPFPHSSAEDTPRNETSGDLLSTSFLVSSSILLGRVPIETPFNYEQSIQTCVRFT